jgi:ABC-type glycerol-3-phosphate transport system permease component
MKPKNPAEKSNWRKEIIWILLGVVFIAAAIIGHLTITRTINLRGYWWAYAIPAACFFLPILVVLKWEIFDSKPSSKGVTDAIMVGAVFGVALLAEAESRLAFLVLR